MAENNHPAEIGVALKKAPPASIDAGTEFSFSAELTWPEGVTSEDATYAIREGDKIVREAPLPAAKSEEDGVEFTVPAPEEVGEHPWTLTVSQGPEEGNETARGSLLLSIKTVPHSTSLAAWDIPSPVVRASSFAVKVGAKCSACCGLGGRHVEIRDDAGSVVGAGALGDTTLPGTTGLYFTTLHLTAPDELKLNTWTVSFAAPELKLAHGGATSSFSFVTVPAPQHSVSVKVVNKATKAPVAGAQIRLGPYRTVTDASGAAKLGVPAGKFRLVVTRAGYAMPERNLNVAKDLNLRIAAEKLPEEDPFAAWTA